MRFRRGGAANAGAVRSALLLFANYFTLRAISRTALGAAHEGIYRLPDTPDGVRPQRLVRLSNASKAWCAPVPMQPGTSCRWAR
jgi:hypothetical protein